MLGATETVLPAPRLTFVNAPPLIEQEETFVFTRVKIVVCPAVMVTVAGVTESVGGFATFTRTVTELEIL